MQYSKVVRYLEEKITATENKKKFLAELSTSARKVQPKEYSDRFELYSCDSSLGAVDIIFTVTCTAAYFVLITTLTDRYERRASLKRQIPKSHIPHKFEAWVKSIEPKEAEPFKNAPEGICDYLIGMIDRGYKNSLCDSSTGKYCRCVHIYGDSVLGDGDDLLLSTNAGDDYATRVLELNTLGYRNEEIYTAISQIEYISKFVSEEYDGAFYHLMHG